MAKNRKYDVNGCPLPLPVVSGVVSGAACLSGQIPGVALTDRRSDGTATVDCGGVYLLPVKGKNKSTNTKIEPGTIVYLKEGNAFLDLNNEEGVRFGYALEVVESGATTTIAVKVGY